MPDLIPPHGGVPEPGNRTVGLLDAVSAAPIPVSDADLSTLYRIADGGRSPPSGPTTREEDRRGRAQRGPRDLFRRKGYDRVVAFQTRNALHRAHEYALVVGLERLTRAGHKAGAVLNPLVGETKADDVDAATRMKTYRALIDNKVLGQGDIDEELWKTVGRN